ncbi:MAG: S41 family peptidase [Alistipes sp.]|nr:S41 family peptidase [Candidatus Alistipes equi]
MKKRILDYVLPTVVVILIFLIGWLYGRASGHKDVRAAVADVLEQNSLTGTNVKISQVLSLIENNYVDKISSDSLAELAIPAILKELDPHSIYMPARDFSKADEAIQGEFDGIGVVFNMATDTVIVLNVVPSGPSQKAGIFSGDRIIKVNDTVIAGQKLSTDFVMSRLRGKRGTRVNLQIERLGSNELIPITVIRGAIPLHSVEARVMLTDEIGFIKLTQFSKTSFSEVMNALSSLHTQGMKKLIFDLRSNSGGLLDQAIAICNEFLHKDDMIVYTLDRNLKKSSQLADGRGRYQDLELVVLLDEFSASASEILAGALQDNDRGTIVGRRSFGKGLVQTQIPFYDGSALRLTIARYYTPTGRSIQKPYVHGNDSDYELDIIRRYNRNEFFSKDSIKFADSLKFLTPKGKVVYGGGGIMPDVFVPLDTLGNSKFYSQVTAKNILFRYTIEYSDRNRSHLQQVQSIKELKEMFSQDKKLYSAFLEYAVRNGVPLERMDSKVKNVMDAQIKAYVARNSKLESDAFYYFITPVDNALQESISILEKGGI